MMQNHSLCESLSYGVSTRGRALGISVLGGLCKIVVRHTNRLGGTKYFKR